MINKAMLRSKDIVLKNNQVKLPYNIRSINKRFSIPYNNITTRFFNKIGLLYGLNKMINKNSINKIKKRQNESLHDKTIKLKSKKIMLVDAIKIMKSNNSVKMSI